MPSLYHYSRRRGSGDDVRSEMKTRLNDVVKVWVSIAQSARASERKSDDLGSIPRYSFREYLAQVAMPSLYRYSRRGGSGDAVRSELTCMHTAVSRVTKRGRHVHFLRRD